MRLLAIATALTIIVLTGVVHGDRTGRWGASQKLQAAVARLDAVPQSFGDWQSKDFGLDPRQVEMGEIAGHVARRYEGPGGAGFTVLIVCGRPGPIAAHTPEWCYGGSGYHAEGISSVEHLESGTDQPAVFWVNTFRKEKVAIPEGLQIWWTWNAGEGWQAPENARLAFARHRFLYKLYVVRNASLDDDHDEEQAVLQDFLRQLMPAVNAALFDEADA